MPQGIDLEFKEKFFFVLRTAKLRLRFFSILGNEEDFSVPGRHSGRSVIGMAVVLAAPL